MTIQQIRIGHDNFSYIIYSQKHNAAVVDPGFSPSTIEMFLKDHKINLKYIITTHYHADHTASISTLQKQHPEAQIIASEIDGHYLPVKVNLKIEDTREIFLDGISLKFLLTPGHTLGSICIIVDDKAIITGDTLFINDCGRTDLPGGSLSQMYNTLQHIIMPLDDNLVVYPGHDYGPKPFDSLGNQKHTNKVLLAKSFEEFSKIE
jgi:glyoxylase-like metal-dependent hydrolase (beta-lactamase superfamily II)